MNDLTLESLAKRVEALENALARKGSNPAQGLAQSHWYVRRQ